jgi:hypothetical protein
VLATVDATVRVTVVVAAAGAAAASIVYGVNGMSCAGIANAVVDAPVHVVLYVPIPAAFTETIDEIVIVQPKLYVINPTPIVPRSTLVTVSTPVADNEATTKGLFDGWFT